ncbi:MAG: tetratricopeptide repeat protein [Phycisphaeraceae bacterium]|nr:tetratricopeptide repeat protein [Phycisphaeraceae bacterium]
MKRSMTIGRGSLAAMLLLTAMLTACNGGKTKEHEVWVNDANNRWNAIKTAQALTMARQKFNTGDLDLAEQDVKGALAADPDNAELHMLLGQIELERSRLERAYQQFTIAIENKPELAQAYYLRGIVLQRISKLELAHADYAKSFELQHDNPAYLLATAEMLVALSRPDEALTLLTGQLDVFDTNAALRLAIAHTYEMKEDYAQAAEFFKQASLLDPDNPRPRQELAEAQLACGKTREAAHTLNDLLNDPAQADRADLRRLLAQAYLKMGRLGDAQRQYQVVVRSSQVRSGDWVELGQIAMRQNNTFDAMHAAGRAIDLDPVNPNGYLLSGMVWQKQQKLEEALSMFDRAAELSPEDAAPLILRGISLQQAGRGAAAAEAYRQALSIDPKDSRARQLLDSLSSAVQ